MSWLQGGLTTICKAFLGGSWVPAEEGAHFGVFPGSRGTGLAPEAGLEHGLAFQHGAGDGEQTVCDTVKRAGMAVAAGSLRRILGLADGIMLYGDAGPVVDRVLQPVVGRQAAHHDHGLARALGDGSDAGQASQGLIISPPQRIVCFCEQRGQDDPTDAGKRAQNFHVTLPLRSRLFLRGCHRLGQRCGQAVHFAMRPNHLLADDDELREDHLEMGDSGFGGAGGDGDPSHAPCTLHAASAAGGLHG